MENLPIEKQQVHQDITWLGVKDKNLSVFDCIMETKYATTYNAYLIKTTAGYVLCETCKACYFDHYVQDIKDAIGDLSQIKYLIQNHTEPDHAGSIQRLLELIPDLMVISTRTGITYLNDITNSKFNHKIADDIKEIVIGNKTFQFINVPFLHWPDSMHTYLKEDKVLFTCDCFGSHYCPKGGILMSELPKEEESNYQDALLYYYTAIFSPFKKYVIQAIDKEDKEMHLFDDLKLICPGHGPVFDCRIREIVDTYYKWSLPAEPRKTKKVVIPYCTAYGYTEELANAIEEGIKAVDSTIEVLKYRLDVLNYGKVKGEVLGHFADADGILFGTSTINGDAIPYIWDLATSLNPIVHGGKVVSSFGSYGWSGEGVDNIIDRLKQIRMKVIEGFKIKFKASKEEYDQAVEFGKKFGNAIVTGKVPELKKKEGSAGINWDNLNPSHQVVLWRCTICGEIYSGVVPPEVCPACGVGQELFELYQADTITYKSETQEKIVIIGSGAASISAAESIRQRNTVCSIDIYTKDNEMPYYRPSVSDLIHQDIPDSEFYLHPKEWYQQNNITIHLEKEVTAIDTTKKTITTSDGEVQYDKLIIGSGSSAFVPPLEGSDLKGVFTMKTAADARALRAFAKNKKNAIVIGGGVLGLETADALLQLGLHVTTIEFMKRVMPRQLDEDASAFIKYILEMKDYNILLGKSTQKIVGDTNGFVTGVMVDDQLINADLVVINIGVRSNVKICKDAGIKVDRCVVVNERMETSAKDVYACGDLVEFDHMNICLWSPALEQGKVAGANAIGDSAPVYKPKVEPLSFLAFDTELYSVGVPPVDNLNDYRILYDADPKTGKFMKLAWKDDKLVYGALFSHTNRVPTLLNGVRDGYDYQTTMNLIYG